MPTCWFQAAFEKESTNVNKKLLERDVRAVFVLVLLDRVAGEFSGYVRGMLFAYEEMVFFNLIKTLPMWYWTVLGLIPSLSDISLYVSSSSRFIS